MKKKILGILWNRIVRSQKNLKAQAAFSLIEVLVTITLIALGAAVVGGQLFDRLDEGKAKSAKIQIQQFSQQLDDYRRLCQQYPTSDQGLEALIAKPSEGPECKGYPEGGFLKGGKLPKDPWENPYIYESDGSNFVITSFGNRGKPGGSGSEADIISNQM